MRSGLARSTLGIAMRSGGAGFDAYAVAGFKPPLVADFGEDYYRKAGAGTTFSGLITHARASDATMVNGSGALVTVSSNTPRVGHHVWNGSAWVNEGILHESEARTNLLHTTDALVTQSHTVTAVPHTLHFTGTGTVTLSGASTAGPLVGTGAGENNRVSLTFTPSAASLTLTVSGTVTNAQLEVGSTRSSYIPNLAGSGTVTRAAETLTIPAASLPYSSTAMSIQMQGRMTYADTNAVEQVQFYRWYAASTNRILCTLNTGGVKFGNVYATQTSGGAGSGLGFGGADDYSPGVLVPFNVATRNTDEDVNLAVDGAAKAADTSPASLPNLASTDLTIGHIFNGTIKKFRMWDANLGDGGLEAGTTT